jgi:hypothetical protein
VEVNVDGVVYECNSQTYMDNNLVTLGINVEPIPIDDVTLPPGGDSGDPPMTPQLGAPGDPNNEPPGGDRDPGDVNPTDPTPPEPSRPAFASEPPDDEPGDSFAASTSNAN